MLWLLMSLRPKEPDHQHPKCLAIFHKYADFDSSRVDKAVCIIYAHWPKQCHAEQSLNHKEAALRHT